MGNFSRGFFNWVVEIWRRRFWTFKPFSKLKGPNLCQFDKWNYQVFIHIKKYKIVYKIRKDHLRIIVFLMAMYKTSKQFTSMQDFENNSLIILDSLGNNFYDIYGTLTVMTLLNLNHFWITQAELCLKGKFVKASFMILTIFWNMKTLGEKTLFTLPVPSIPR